jgi:hypothetical protein
LKNYGTTTLTSMNINWNLDGGATTILPWTGSLATYATTVVSLGSIACGNGDHTLTVFTGDPNGGIDGDPLNDQHTRDFHNTTPAQTITLHIQLDNYPEETSWQLTPSGGGAVIASGGAYASEPDGGTVDVPLCVANGCYDLTFYDAAGDGICCVYGNGNFEVHDPYGNTYVTNNGQYGTSVTENFCVSNTGVNEVGGDRPITMAPNPASAQVMIALPNSGERADIAFCDAAGREVLRARTTCAGTMTLPLAGIADGIYAVTIDINGTRTISRLTIDR